jgi:replication-associated recombination protein RarA
LSTHTDRHGDPIDISTVNDTETGVRSIRIEAEAPVFLFTPERARRIAADLIAAAEAAENAAKESVCGERLEAIRALAGSAIQYVQAGQSDPALYDMLSALRRSLDGDDADALAHLDTERAEQAFRGQRADRQREAWGLDIK